jgi:glucokinase
MDDAHFGGARLLADIGGTNARFALQRGSGSGTSDDIATLACADYPAFTDAVRAYLARHPGAAREVRHAVIAIANPVEGDFVKMTNHCWQFSIEAARLDLGLDTLLVVNDFAALSMSVPGLADADLALVGGRMARPDAVIGLVGAGTGLGVGGVIPRTGPGAGGWTVLPSEGGHVAFSPSDAREQAILTYCWTKWEHVSAERLISGPGLALIHEALCVRDGVGHDNLDPAGVVERGLAGDARCAETLDVFCGMLGTMAANVAVTLCARGGIYIGGGVVPRLGDFFARSSFRKRFENKGRFTDFCKAIPCYVIHAPYPALAGAAAMLEQHLADARASAQHAPIDSATASHHAHA